MFDEAFTSTANRAGQYGKMYYQDNYRCILHNIDK